MVHFRALLMQSARNIRADYSGYAGTSNACVDGQCPMSEQKPKQSDKSVVRPATSCAKSGRAASGAVTAVVPVTRMVSRPSVQVVNGRLVAVLALQRA